MSQLKNDIMTAPDNQKRVWNLEIGKTASPRDTENVSTTSKIEVILM